MATEKKVETKVEKIVTETPVSPTPVASGSDVDQNKVYAILAYIGILFIVPLLASKDSPFAKFHANQGFVLFLAGIVIGLVAWIPVIGWIVGLFGWIAILVLAIMGIMNAANGKMEKLPLIGDIELIK